MKSIPPDYDPFYANVQYELDGATREAKPMQFNVRTPICRCDFNVITNSNGIDFIVTIA